MDAPKNTHVVVNGIRVPMRYMGTSKRCDAVGCTRDIRKPMKWCGTHRKQAEQMDPHLRELAKFFYAVKWPLKKCAFEGCETQVRKGNCKKHMQTRHREANRERYREYQRNYKRKQRNNKLSDKQALTRCIEQVVKNKLLAQHVFDAIFKMGKESCRCRKSTSSAPSC